MRRRSYRRRYGRRGKRGIFRGKRFRTYRVTQGGVTL